MGSVDIPKDKGLELHITKTIYPDSKRVGTTPTKTTSSFFSDPTNRNYGGATALTSPKTFDDTYESSFNDLYEFGRSVSSYQGKVEDWELVQNELETKFGIEIPHWEDYIPEIDDQYRWSRPFSNFGVDGAGGNMMPEAPFEVKKKYLENLISTELDKLGPEAKKNFKGYDHYFDLRKKQAADTQEQMALNMQYADSGWDKWGGMLSGTAVASFHDPLILASLPLSMMYGWQGGIIYATMRTAAMEAIIAGGAETLIQTQVVPYRQSLGQDYTWSDAAKIIGTVSATSGLFAGTLTAGVKSSVQLYKNAEIALTKTSPKIRNKIIGKAFEKWSKELNYKKLEDMPPDVVWKIIQANIDALPRHEMLLLFKTFPDAIRLHAPYKSAARELEEKILEDVDNPLSKDIEGTVEHMERTNSTLESVLRNEEPKIPEQPNSPIILDEKRPVMNHIKMNPDDIEVDAKTFQFKTGGDSKGVLTTLKGVDKWDHNAAGTVMVWERADGKFFIADGHQRLGLAKRIKSKDPKQDVYLMTVVRREADGWNAEDVMVEAMTVNIVAGTARSEDVARVFLRMGETHTANILAGRIKPQQALYQNSLGLYRLGDEAFRYWLKGGIKDNIAAQVGHLIDDPQLAINALKLLERTKPANINEARSIIRSFIDAGIIKTKQTDLFGARIIKESLIVERSKVYSSALRELKKDKTIFKALVENDEAIIKSGRNKLDTDYNVEKAEQYGIIIHKIEKLANRKGRLSDELTAAAKLWKAGSKRKAVESFKKAVYESIERGDHEGITPSGSERSIFASQSESPARQKPKENIITEKLKVHDDPHDTNVVVKEADDQLEEIKLEVFEDPLSGIGIVREADEELDLLLSGRIPADYKLSTRQKIKIAEYDIKKEKTFYDTQIKDFKEIYKDLPGELDAQIKSSTKDYNRKIKKLEKHLKDLQEEEGIISAGAAGKDKTLATSRASVADQEFEALSQATMTEPPLPVFARATSVPSKSRGSVESSIGSFKEVKGTKHLILNSTDDVEDILETASMQIDEITDELNFIGKNISKDAEIKVDIKKTQRIKQKLKEKQAIHGKNYGASLLGDLVRGRILLNSLDDITALDTYLRKNYQIISRKDYFSSPKETTGYRAIHYQLKSEYGLDDLGFELQVHHKELFDVIDKLRDLPNSSYTKYRGVKKTTAAQDEDIAKLAAKEKVIIDKKFNELNLQQKGLPEQRAVDIGLFDANARNQLDLTDEVVMDIKTGADGELVPDTKTLKQVLDDVEEDDKIINFLKDCPGIS